jgi:hypothetical protein
LEGRQLLVERHRSDNISQLVRCWLRIAGKLWMTFRILSYRDNGQRRELTLEGWTLIVETRFSFPIFYPRGRSKAGTDLGRWGYTRGIKGYRLTG